MAITTLLAAERRVHEVDVHVGLGEREHHVDQPAGAMIGLDHEHSRMSATPIPSRASACLALHVVVVDQRVHEAAAVAGERGQAAQVHTGGDRHLAEPRELAGLVPHHNREVGRHRRRIMSRGQKMRSKRRAKSAVGSEPRPMPVGPP